MKLKTTLLLASTLLICISSVFAGSNAPLFSLSSSNNLVPNYQFKDSDGNPSLEEWTNTVATAPNTITAVAGTGENHQVLISKTDVSGSWSDVKMGITWQDIALSTQEGDVQLNLSAKVKASNDDDVKFRFYFRYRTKEEDGSIKNNNVYSDIFDLTSTEQDFVVPIEVPKNAVQWNLDVQFGGSKSGAVGDIYFSVPSLTLETGGSDKPEEPSDPDNLIPDDKFADALGNPTLAVWSNTVATAPNTIQAVEGTTNYNKVQINKVDAITGNWSTLVMALPWQNIDLPQETENVSFELSAKALASNDDGAKFRFNFRYRTPDGDGGFTNHDVNSNQFVLTSTEKTFLTNFEIPKNAYQWNIGVQFGGSDSGVPAVITFSHPLLKIVQASGPTDDELVAEAKENLEITYASGEDATNVTHDVTLPSVGQNDVTVSWSSSDATAITDAGVVTRQDEDTEVTLTATLTKNEATATKEFTLKVIAREPTDEELVASAKENLAIIYADDEGANSVTQDVTLTTTGENDVTVSWSSSNATVVTDAGVVTRQDEDTDVTLTATLTKNEATATKEFTITVLGEGTPPPTDEELVALAKENLEITFAEGEDAMTVTQDVTLPTSGENAVTIAWASSNTSVVSETGVVTRDEVDTDVVLTATLTKNEATATKEFTIKVLLEEREPTEEELVEEAKNALEIVFEEGDDADNVSRNITLTTNGINNTSITWDASAHSNITNAGVVTITDNAVTASIVATISLGNFSDQKSFTLTTVPTSDDVIVDKVVDRLAIEYAEGDDQNSVTQSVTLPTSDDEYENVQISWASNNEAVISNSGVLTVPVEVTEVTLTATVTLNTSTSTKTFILTVPNDEDELIQEVYDDLEIVFAEGEDAEGITKDITLATEGMYNSSITWVTDRTTITSEGVVTRSFRDVTTNLTATIQLGSTTLIKEFEVVVLAEEQVTSVDRNKVELKLYPNPTFADITVESSQPIQVIEIYNLIGVSIKVIEFDQYIQKTTLSLDDLPRGQYILRVNNQPIKFIKK
ncbi:immunoglobulin-like domain-containing protein [Flammeovirga aprica]|uniref:T9SS type A sorting domain-containing protein n=1 Tax=Flammeovirga aprica JL-4 TaxID=694437 RepID=A0A7X9XAN8_9BACT|nr:immunoglobulin-like domain-containing protein [Flammeovirga aprica]NME69866.1 T9SS type A sorting domain-containing protein [Flammeovirga aprica JL-4]